MKHSVLFYRVNNQPPVLLDLSQDELLVILISVVIISIISSCLLFALVWRWYGGLPLSLILAPWLTKLVGRRYARMKTGKPDNYYPLIIKGQIERLIDIFLGTTNAIKPGTWSTTRRNRYEQGE